MNEKQAIRRWRAGHAAAQRQQRAIAAAEGPQRALAVAEALSALNALELMGRWPGRSNPISERAVDVVRNRWARIKRRARATQQR